jgi:hypothetical protein
MNAKGPDQKMEFDGTTYSVYVQRSDMAVGAVSVSGSRITFSGSNTCAGSGTYSWKVAGGTLSFKRLTADPCPRRSLLKHTWSRR